MIIYLSVRKINNVNDNNSVVFIAAVAVVVVVVAAAVLRSLLLRTLAMTGLTSLFQVFWSSKGAGFTSY